MYFVQINDFVEMNKININLQLLPKFNFYNSHKKCLHTNFLVLLYFYKLFIMNVKSNEKKIKFFKQFVFMYI